MPGARETAVEALIRCERGGYSNLVLMNMLSGNGLDVRDRAFCTALVYGTLSRIITIDALISRFSGRELAKLDTEVLQILRSAVYQMFWMDSVPVRAAINESVELCRRFRKSSAAGFVNAVLRKCSFQEISSVWSGTEDETEKLSLKYSLTEELVRLLKDQFGEKTESVMEAMFRRERMFLRVNPLLSTSEEVIAELELEGITAAETVIPNCLRVVSGNPIGTEVLESGRARVQSLPAQYAAFAASAVPGSRVLDMCAAPGGKTVCMAQDMGNKGSVTSLDLNGNRLKLIESLTDMQKIDIVKTIQCDAAEFKDTEQYDTVLCDVPCSGYGEIQSKPELRYKDPGISADLPDLQYRILCNGARLTRPGGRLVYSTCTILDRENKDIVRRFLEEHREFALSLPERIPEGALTDGEMVSFVPGVQGSEGFFVAVLDKM